LSHTQYKVYGVLARSSSNSKQQLDAYLKTMEILKDDPERVDYALEIAQVLKLGSVLGLGLGSGLAILVLP
jgi:hypothetical protein